MTLPIKPLPIVERWDCTGCGKCCRGNVVPLDEDDLAKLREQEWHKHPDYQGVKTVVRRGLFGGRPHLGQRDDGTCVFLMEDGLCRIHKDFGFERKPLICQMYPLQIVPVGKTAYLTMRRSCPTAAADQGRPMAEHIKEAKDFARQRPRIAEQISPPKITRRHRRSWKETMQVTAAIEKLMTDAKFPLIRRIVHGLRFCDLLEQCRLQNTDAQDLGELTAVLREAAIDESSELFREGQPPSRSARPLFRLTVAGYLRLHPSYHVRESWSERWRLAWSAFKFARGKQEVPRIHESFPAANFKDLEEPFGHFEQSVQQPLNAYFEANAVSKQYAVAVRQGWSIVEKFRALALAYPAALWMMRYFLQGNSPTPEDAIDMVTTIDRGQGHDALVGPIHRRRIASLKQLGALEQLAIWYAR